MTDSQKNIPSKLPQQPDSILEMDKKVGTFALLEAVSVVDIGAFMHWGFSKDLFVPASEQKAKMAKGELSIVYIYRDERTSRIAASTKLDKYLDKVPVDFKEDDNVNLLICDPTEMGYKAIINNAHWGLLYKDEVFQALHYGQRIDGFVKKIRADGKIDVCLQKAGYQSMDSLSEKVLEYLKASKGACSLTDKTSPEIIYRLFGVSKKKFKMTIGVLYKKKLIAIDDQGIKLIKNEAESL